MAKKTFTNAKILKTLDKVRENAKTLVCDNVTPIITAGEITEAQVKKISTFAAKLTAQAESMQAEIEKIKAKEAN